MIFAELGLLVVIVVAHIWSVRWISRFHEDRVQRQDEADEARRQTVYKMEKAAIRTVAASDRAVRKMVDKTQALHDETKLLHRRVDRHVSDLKKGAHRGG